MKANLKQIDKPIKKLVQNIPSYYCTYFTQKLRK